MYELSEKNKEMIIEKGKEEISFANEHFAKYSLPSPFTITLVLLACAFGAFLYRSGNRFLEKRREEAKKRAPYRNAKRDLRVLGTTNPEALYTRLSFIVRSYFESKYKIPGKTKTTEEFIQNLRVQKIANPKIQEIHTLLQECDLVKFAKKTATTTQCEADILLVRQIIERM